MLESLLLNLNLGCDVLGDIEGRLGHRAILLEFFLIVPQSSSFLDNHSDTYLTFSLCAGLKILARLKSREIRELSNSCLHLLRCSLNWRMTSCSSERVQLSRSILSPSYHCLYLHYSCVTLVFDLAHVLHKGFGVDLLRNDLISQQFLLILQGLQFHFVYSQKLIL